MPLPPSVSVFPLLGFHSYLLARHFQHFTLCDSLFDVLLSTVKSIKTTRAIHLGFLVFDKAALGHIAAATEG